MSMESTIITKQLLKRQSGEFDLESIHILKLNNLGINDLDSIKDCTSLERLDLSQNDITELQPLTSLKLVSYLNLSANRITNIEPLKELESLQTLNLAGNLIGSFSNLKCLTVLQSLHNLRLRDNTEKLTNPLCNSSSYRETVRDMFTHLKVLDGEQISGKGCELFDMLRALDTAIDGGSKPESGAIQSAGAWITNGFWDKNRFDDDVDLNQAESSFNEILRDCRKLNVAATLSLAEGSQSCPPKS